MNMSKIRGSISAGMPMPRVLDPDHDLAALRSAVSMRRLVRVLGGVVQEVR